MKSVKIYSKEHCPYCIKAKQFFKSKGIAFEEMDVTNRQDLRDQLEKETGWMTVPMIFIGDKFIGGYDNLAQLDQEGKLSALLQ